MQQAVHFGLGGRVVVITGGSQGIGEACARRLVRDGAAVALWDVADAAGQRLADELVAAGHRALYCHCNVISSADVQAALAATLAAFGHVDGLVNNAGIFRAAEFLDITEADWDAVIAVNLKGAFLVGQAVAREMVQLGRGAVVNMSSVNGRMAIPTIASYNASKGAIDQLTRVMALSLADKRRARQRGGAGHHRHRTGEECRADQRCGQGPHHEPHADEAGSASRARSPTSAPGC